MRSFSGASLHGKPRRDARTPSSFKTNRGIKIQSKEWRRAPKTISEKQTCIAIKKLNMPSRRKSSVQRSQRSTRFNPIRKIRHARVDSKNGVRNVRFNEHA